jgi:signal transduction histidine kinase
LLIGFRPSIAAGALSTDPVQQLLPDGRSVRRRSGELGFRNGNRRMIQAAMSKQSLQSLQEENAQLRAQVDVLRAQLIQADRQSTQGTLTTSITHEFNNILTTVINYAKLGLRNKQPESRDRAFDKILSAGQRAARITSGVLAYARSRGDRREPTAIIPLVSDTLILMDKDLHVHRIGLEFQHAGEPYAEVNPGEIQQVLLNLMINARQAMQPGGTLTVKVQENAADEVVEISVKDTGQGIPADKLPRIFDQFFSTKTADEHGQGGTGLGLSLCKSVIERHQGRIRVESAVGRGTVFTIKLPRAERPRLLSSTPPSVAAKVG